MALYHKRDVLTFFSLISDGLCSVTWLTVLMCIVVLGNHEKFVHKMEWFRDFPLKNVALLYFFKFPTLTYFVMIILVHLRSKCIPIFLWFSVTIQWQRTRLPMTWLCYLFRQFVTKEITCPEVIIKKEHLWNIKMILPNNIFFAWCKYVLPPST